MPGGETTSTNLHNAPEPIGWVSAIISGPVNPLDQADRPNIEIMRGRVCEVVWLDGELFGQDEPVVLFASSEDTYQDQLVQNGAAGRPGKIEEQLVLRELDFSMLALGQSLRVGDALVKILDLNQSTMKLELVEEGLVEPGSPVVVVS